MLILLAVIRHGVVCELNFLHAGFTRDLSGRNNQFTCQTHRSKWDCFDLHSGLCSTPLTKSCRLLPI